jgi:hypothetical protein
MEGFDVTSGGSNRSEFHEAPGIRTSENGSDTIHRIGETIMGIVICQETILSK